jgi:hypothetical protein
VCEFPNSSLSDKLIFHLIKHFHDKGSVNNMKHSGRPSLSGDKSVEYMCIKFVTISMIVSKKNYCLMLIQ